MKYFAYILESSVDGNYYYGSTSDINQRLDRHNLGRVDATKNRRPFKLLGYFQFETRDEAIKQEYYLKKSKNKKYVIKLVGIYGVIV